MLLLACQPLLATTSEQFDVPRNKCPETLHFKLYTLSLCCWSTADKYFKPTRRKCLSWPSPCRFGFRHTARAQSLAMPSRAASQNTIRSRAREATETGATFLTGVPSCWFCSSQLQNMPNVCSQERTLPAHPQFATKVRFDSCDCDCAATLTRRPQAAGAKMLGQHLVTDPRRLLLEVPGKRMTPGLVHYSTVLGLSHSLWGSKTRLADWLLHYQRRLDNSSHAQRYQLVHLYLYWFAFFFFFFLFFFFLLLLLLLLLPCFLLVV